jgi:SPP1 gp7 family putative phage head morphogenesis protein
MRFDLAKIARQVGYRRKSTTFRPITLPKSVAAEYFAIIQPVLTNVRNAVPAIMAQYERSLRELTTDKASDVEVEISALEQFGQSIGVVFSARIMRWIERVESMHRSKFSANVLTPVSVNLATMIGQADVIETLETFLARNVALIKDIHAQQKAKISEIVFRGLQSRTPARTVARDISEATGFARQRATRIASDQLQKITSALDEERMRQAGLDEYIWQHSDKVNFRPEHKARDGKKYKLGEFGDDEPGMRPFCGCKRAPVLSFE